MNEIEKQIIQNEIPAEIFEEDMKRRLRWILFEEKYKKCYERLKKEWIDDLDSQGRSKLARNGINSIPTDPDQLAELIFSQPNYKNRSQREEIK